MVRKIRAKLVLRLRAEGLSGRQIAAQGMSRHSVAAVLEAADREGVGWNDVEDLDELAVYARLFPGRGEHESVYAQPDWRVVHRELARVGVTLKLLHSEYVDRCNTDGVPAMGYDRFCKHYQQHVLVNGAASRVGHKAGQSVEVDWSGPTMSLTDPVSGRIKLVVDDAHATFTHSKVEGLIRRAALRYPNADLRRLDLVEQRGLDRGVIAQLGTCTFIARQQNVVFQGFTGSGKSYLGSALAKQACQHRYRAHYIRMPDLEEGWAAARDKPGGKEKWLRKYAAFTLLVIDEWLLDPPGDDIRSMLLELLERRYDTTSTVLCTQYPKKDWHQRLGSGVHADAIMDRIVHNTIWIETGNTNMREHAALAR